MAIHVALQHSTAYSYDRHVQHAPHVIRLRPAPHCRTKILSYSLKIHGGEYFINWQQDPFSNWNARLVFPTPLKELVVEVGLVAEIAVYNPFDFFLEDSASFVPFEYDSVLARDLAPFLVQDQIGPLVQALVKPLQKSLEEGASSSSPSKLATADFLVALNRQIQERVRYQIRLEPGVQSPEETLEKQSGSCRDSAWLMCVILRRLGFAARFVSGYLVQLKADEVPLQGPSGPEIDFTDLHAWCEVYLPGAGWIGFDPTSGLLAGEGHIPLSCTPEPSTAAPVSGAVDPCVSEMTHKMSVSRVYESPRVTKPYTGKQWQEINALGQKIDDHLRADDVRLTMGGEPTFVLMSDPDGAEWNFTALSAKKRVLGAALLKRLRTRYSPGALLHYGQGKWYPGEPLPRWSLNAFWRKDGEPIWRDMQWIADEDKDYGFGAKEAHKFAMALVHELSLDAAHLMPAHEDVAYHLWREKRLPVNVSPEDSKLRNAEERMRFARLFESGIGSIVGYVLPVQCRSGVWESGAWFFKDSAPLWLVPGDSPIGLRLPLDSLPWVSDPDFPAIIPSDPSEPLPRFSTHSSLRKTTANQNATKSKATPARGAATSEAGGARRPKTGESASWVVRTALCVEARDGRLFVFIPPVTRAEDYLLLVTAIEAAAEACGFPVILEGEAPPKDARIQKFSVTPDPGVIEVNLHPSSSWDELVSRMETLYEEARAVGLGTEKFMMDGKQTGTGGGNHIILGADTPLDSPVLRRPDLLRSMLTYWQNHPSLSWMFSGMFIGPTSQAPRIDEARHDSLYELEIAFSQLPEKPGTAAPWLVDRLFRHLLVDATGNTHRAEFCIDKLYAPETSTGRLGLLELRAFEMAPHPRMNLVQQLLLRALVARFWKRPFESRLISWGTELHDRWMLPHFCESDFNEVLRDLAQQGFALDPDWFLPHFEYRFPKIGEFTQCDVHIELRTALEPWHVLGEEAAGGATVRNVDSSLERIQIKVQGMIGERFSVLCNGRRVPLRATGTNGECIAGVRYRAWQPPSCLHPTIPPHAPLTFDLWDHWNGMSRGGCTYHVAHSGGRNYETRPVNASEAESRRLARFTLSGHTLATDAPVNETPNPNFPYTLDLRLPARW